MVDALKSAPQQHLKSTAKSVFKHALLKSWEGENREALPWRCVGHCAAGDAVLAGARSGWVAGMHFARAILSLSHS